MYFPSTWQKWVLTILGSFYLGFIPVAIVFGFLTENVLYERVLSNYAEKLKNEFVAAERFEEGEYEEIERKYQSFKKAKEEYERNERKLRNFRDNVAIKDETLKKTAHSTYRKKKVETLKDQEGLINVIRIDEIFTETAQEKNEDLVKLQRGRKIDFQEQSIQNQNLGLMGEEFVLEYEISQLKKANRLDLVALVDHASKREGDGLGYDIVSFNNETGERMFIEVKTTAGGIGTQFFMTENELNVMRGYKNYCIYRVFEFDLQTKKGKLFKIMGKGEIEKYFDIKAVNYKVTPRLSE